MIKEVSGNLLTATEQYIAHQCNCVSNYAAGLAKDIFTRYPYSDIYTKRLIRHNPGSIEICGDGESQRFIINMMAQVYPGKSKYDTGVDTTEKRQEYFATCLNKIAQIHNIQSLALPAYIGCGLAGGNWDSYIAIINEFTLTNNIPTTIYYKD